MNNSLENGNFYNKKTSYEKKLKSIFTEIRNRQNIDNLLTESIRNIIYDDDFNLDDLSNFSIFNESVLKNLNIINLFLLQPAYLTINQSLITNLGDIIKLYSLIFIGFFTLFIVSVLIFYFFDWTPLQNNLDSTVKNFLFRNILTINLQFFPN